MYTADVRRRAEAAAKTAQAGQTDAQAGFNPGAATYAATDAATDVDARNPHCRCKHGGFRACPKGGADPCPNFGIRKLGSYPKYYHPQWMLDRRP